MTFRAKYDGECANECGERIHVGDEVEYVENELMHANCNAPECSPRPVCHVCWMEKALNGACGCEESP